MSKSMIHLMDHPNFCKSSLSSIAEDLPKVGFKEIPDCFTLLLHSVRSFDFFGNFIMLILGTIQQMSRQDRLKIEIWKPSIVLAGGSICRMLLIDFSHLGIGPRVPFIKLRMNASTLLRRMIMDTSILNGICPNGGRLFYEVSCVVEGGVFIVRRLLYYDRQIW